MLADLYERAGEIAHEYDADTIAGLAPQEGWTDADAPLLDELADLLGIIDDEQAEQQEREEWLDKIAEAQDALDILTGSASQDLDDGFAPEVLMAYDVIDAEQLAGRQRARDHRTTAQRAADDMRWAYGHVIVDEAQELSAMDWRMVFRRSPNRWLTVVGDPAQTGNPAGVDTWEETMTPYVADRWQLRELTVNYRTPQDIADLANRLLPEIAPEQQPAVALRNTGRGVVIAGLDDFESQITKIVERAGKGLVGVIGAEPIVSAVQQRWTEAGFEAADNVLFVHVTQAKGLEFDEVVLLEPATIVAASPQGLNDVYVAITRATQGLTVLADELLPWE